MYLSKLGSKSSTRIQFRTQRTSSKQLTTRQKSPSPFRFQCYTTIDPSLINNKNTHRKTKYGIDQQRLLTKNSRRSSSTKIFRSVANLSKQLSNPPSRQISSNKKNSSTTQRVSQYNTLDATPTMKNPKRIQKQLYRWNIHEVMQLNSLQTAKSVTNIAKYRQQNVNVINYDQKRQNIIQQLSSQTSKMISDIQKGARKSLESGQSLLVNVSNRFQKKNRGLKQEFRVDLMLGQWNSKPINAQQGVRHKKQYKTSLDVTSDFIVKNRPQDFSKQMSKKSTKQYIQSPTKQHTQKRPPPRPSKTITLIQPNQQSQVSNLLTQNSRLIQPPVIQKEMQYSQSQLSIQEIKLSTPINDTLNQKQNRPSSSIPKEDKIQQQLNTIKTQNILNHDRQQETFISRLSLEQQCQQLTRVGQIVGHGLRMLKDIKINWILPCIPIYQRFYQLRCQVLQKAKQQTNNQLQTQISTQNQVVKKSFINMLKSAVKKPISTHQLNIIKQLQITDKVSNQTIINQIDSYVSIVNQYQAKEEHLLLIKKHLALIINSAIRLGKLQSKNNKVTILTKCIDPQSKNIDEQLSKGLNDVSLILN